MNNKVTAKFVNMGSAQRAQMIASARQYINNDQFLNLLQNVDINDVHIKNKNKPTNIYWISAQLVAFNGIPQLCAQVDTWLRSC